MAVMTGEEEVPSRSPIATSLGRSTARPPSVTRHWSRAIRSGGCRSSIPGSDDCGTHPC